jgi:hypothetical protein
MGSVISGAAAGAICTVTTIVTFFHDSMPGPMYFAIVIAAVVVLVLQPAFERALILNGQHARVKP